MKDRITISVSSISVFNNFPEENEEGGNIMVVYGGDGDNVVEMRVWMLVAKREGGMWWVWDVDGDKIYYHVNLRILHINPPEGLRERTEYVLQL